MELLHTCCMHLYLQYYIMLYASEKHNFLESSWMPTDLDDTISFDFPIRLSRAGVFDFKTIVKYA